MAQNSKLSKSQILQGLAESTGLSKKQVEEVLDSLTNLISEQVGKKGPGVFQLTGLMKIQRVHKPAKKARKGKNPFTGEEMMFKPQPARNVIKIRPLKTLKSMV